jgi:hypothetical protein
MNTWSVFPALLFLVARLLHWGWIWGTHFFSSKGKNGFAYDERKAVDSVYLHTTLRGRALEAVRTGVMEAAYLLEDL